MSASHYTGDEVLGAYEVGEIGSRMQFEACDSAAPRGCLTVGEFQRIQTRNLQPLFARYGVDVYNAGHVHSCECRSCHQLSASVTARVRMHYNFVSLRFAAADENTWPLCNLTTGEVCKAANGSSLQSFHEPQGTVHVTEGNGGVPGVPGNFSYASCTRDSNSTCRMKGTGGAYGRITATATTLSYDRVANNGGSITDTWTITNTRHGPFPAMQ